jgi:putative oxidoreductase
VLRWLDKHRDLGLLILRVGLGTLFMRHGYPKLAGGPAAWERYGHSMANLGITFAPTFWGLMAGLAEFGGGVCLVLGLLVRPAAAMMLFTMFVAVVGHLHAGDGFGDWSHAAEDGVAFASLVILGAGRFGLDAKLGGRSSSKKKA